MSASIGRAHLSVASTVLLGFKEMDNSYRITTIPLLTFFLLCSTVGSAYDTTGQEEPSEEKKSSIVTPAPGGKGPGMGRQYQQNTPGPGKGSPEYRGGSEEDQEPEPTAPASEDNNSDSSEKELSADNGHRRADADKAPKHRQYANPPLTPVDPVTDVRPEPPAKAGPRRALLHAAAFGDTAGVTSLLESGASPNSRSKDKRGRTALILASQGGHVAVVRTLLAEGARLEDRDKNGNTALNWAAMRGQLESARVLLDAGADVNTINNGLVSPVLYGVGTRNKAMIRLLAEHGADLDAETRDNQMTPLLLAIEHRNREISQLLVEAGADVNKQNSDGISPLMAAADKADPDIARMLLAAGARIDTKDKKGRTALAFARQAGNESTIEVLLAAAPEG